MPRASRGSRPSYEPASPKLLASTVARTEPAWTSMSRRRTVTVPPWSLLRIAMLGSARALCAHRTASRPRSSTVPVDPHERSIIQHARLMSIVRLGGSKVMSGARPRTITVAGVNVPDEIRASIAPLPSAGAWSDLRRNQSSIWRLAPGASGRLRPRGADTLTGRVTAAFPVEHRCAVPVAGDERELDRSRSGRHVAIGRRGRCLLRPRRASYGSSARRLQRAAA